jgi:hypothetical protein
VLGASNPSRHRGQRSFVVEHLVPQAERWIVHTELSREAVEGA